jgi:Xaa-Pro aminopeptidase
MLTMHPTLLIGPADWDVARLPQQEFAARIAKLWELVPQASSAIVYGDSQDHRALAWLTAFTPKLEPAIALIPRAGAIRLMVGGGANMLPSAKPLTWVTDLVSLRPAGKTIAQWREANRGPCFCVGIDAMPTRLRREFDAAFDGRPPEDSAAALGPLMRVKSARELACMREASALLRAVVAAMADAKRSGVGVTATILAGEHAAVRGGAQDVRSMFSLDGGRTLRPFGGPVARPADPLQVYVAVRRFGYWADGFTLLSDKPDDDLAQAQAVLRTFLAQAKPGALLAAPIVGNGIGLALDEPMNDGRLQAGGVYSLRTGTGRATVSAMVAVSETGIESLWSAA